MVDIFSMAGRRCLVTGGSVSMGRAIALGFAAQGAAVAIHHSAAADAAFGLPNAAAETVAAIEALGVAGFAIEGDFLDPNAPPAIFRRAEAALGGVDVLVLCASVQTRAPFEEIGPEQIEREVLINFAATVALLQVAIPPMRARRWGRVLTVGSINQVRPEPQLATYAALKAAQANLAANLAVQCARDGVMVNNIAPGIVATERNRWRRQDPAEWAEIQRRAAPTIGRAALPQEVVGAAILLCSDAASYISGADLPITAAAHLPAAQ
ncbi:SDR family NAD(P)-dependent oxidoreductase [Falsiroseomonas sp. HW251]|uniref:SDR family NAD(P)-dependent oxidoreductase n=1 Tax=Falsiroseomonas sp. HW251 TaxID=3390998 RepID=UPI003D3107B4